MIRLAVIGDTDIWSQVGLRLRRAVITDCFAASEMTQAFDAPCDAMVFASLGGKVESVLPQLAQSRIPKLLIANSILQAVHSSAEKATLSESLCKPGQIHWANMDCHRPSRQLIHQQIRSGNLGSIGLIRLHRWQSALWNDERSDPVPIELICDLDLICWLTGQEPQSVFVTQSAARGVGHSLQIQIRYAGGTMVLMNVSQLPEIASEYQSLSVIGASGAAYADDQQNTQLLYRDQGAQAVQTDEGLRSLVNLTQEFIDRVVTPNDPITPLLQHRWSTVLRFRLAVEAALKTRQVVAWGEC